MAMGRNCLRLLLAALTLLLALCLVGGKRHACKRYTDRAADAAFERIADEEKGNWEKNNEKYDKKHGRKKFTNDWEERRQRKRLVRAAAKRVNKLNAQHGGTVCMKLNKFAAMDAEEFADNYLGLPKAAPGDRRKYDRKRITRNSGSGSYYARRHKRWYDIKPSIFWDTGPVTDQEGCRSCTHFAAVHALSAHLWRRQSAGRPLHYSERQALDCAASPECDCWFGCNHWTMMDHFLTNGLTTDRSYARYDGYASAETGPRPAACSKALNGSLLEAYSVSYEFGNDELLESLQRGPVVTVICTDDTLVDYEKGILGVWGDSYPYCEEPNHSVAVVGYGTEDGVDYWIVKNSYGAEWGEGGYFRVKRDAGMGTRRWHILGYYVTEFWLDRRPNVRNADYYDYNLGSHDCADDPSATGYCWMLPCTPGCGEALAGGEPMNCTEVDGALRMCQRTCQYYWPYGTGVCPLQRPPDYVRPHLGL